LKIWIVGGLLLVFAESLTTAQSLTSAERLRLRFEVTMSNQMTNPASNGRLFIILSTTNEPEPRLALGRTGAKEPMAFAQDVNRFAPRSKAVVDATAFGFPITNILAIPAGNYFVQALFDDNPDLRLANAPGNRYSAVKFVRINPAISELIKLEIKAQIPPETVPPETEQVKFVRMKSEVLSRFCNRPILLRAGIILPRDFQENSPSKYPLWIRIGGLNTRYDTVQGLMAKDSHFRRDWMAPEAPRFVLLQLDGAGPLGDPYQINSANHGPYGDALMKELLPLVEQKFHCQGTGQSRVLSGTSTGGWVSLALQIFYPDSFNGVWSSCPDPVDFRALQRVNIYRDANAFMDEHQEDRPSERDAKGVPKLTMREEVQVENLLGRGNKYAFSGEQWGEWTATFSARQADGSPALLWDPITGAIDSKVAEEWKKYDLRLYLEKNWDKLAPKLKGKIHIAAGEADQYFLNEAVHLLENALKELKPPFEGKIVYGPGKGHGWMDLSLKQMLREMELAVSGRKE
jgi:S-formylglutathione hydrolase FrmB